MASLLSHWRYARYVLKHKWFVWQASRKLGIPWLGLLHDLSKFSPDEWFPYVESFYGGYATKADRPVHVRRAFDRAYLTHVRRNKHHPYAWVAYINPTVVPDPLGESIEAVVFPLPMPERYVREMIADWEGARLASSAPGRSTSREWYAERGCSLPLHPETRALVERLLPLLEGRA